MTQDDPFKAIADPTRRAILDRLRKGPASVGELTDGLPISQSAVSQQLGVLRAAGFVKQERQGTRRIYSADVSGLDPVRNWIAAYDAGSVAEQPDPASTPLVLENPLPEADPVPSQKPDKPSGLSGLDRLARQQEISRVFKSD